MGTVAVFILIFPLTLPKIITDMTTTTAFDEIVDFIASENPKRVLSFKASDATRKRVFDLIEKSKQGQLPEKEQAELDHYLTLEHLMRLAKIKAYQMLQE
jgi:ATP-dependent RNA circularization protein (DNA/RNA ligase family)